MPYAAQAELLLACAYMECWQPPEGLEEAVHPLAARAAPPAANGSGAHNTRQQQQQQQQPLEAPVDFGVWQPVDVPLAPPHGALVQLASNGWEWTSTAFDAHPGFTTHPLYPEYSADFMPSLSATCRGSHVVLLRGSWATLGGIASRRSFRNWYQRGYPYAFAKFRLCAK